MWWLVPGERDWKGVVGWREGGARAVWFFLGRLTEKASWPVGAVGSGPGPAGPGGEGWWFVCRRAAGGKVYSLRSGGGWLVLWAGPVYLREDFFVFFPSLSLTFLSFLSVLTSRSRSRLRSELVEPPECVRGSALLDVAEEVEGWVSAAAAGSNLSASLAAARLARGVSGGSSAGLETLVGVEGGAGAACVAA